MNLESTKNFYGQHYIKLIEAKELIEDMLLTDCKEKIEHFKTRIKTKESAQSKLLKLNYECSSQDAIQHLTDIIGIRIVCRFLSDVYEVAEIIEKNKFIELVMCKNYINDPKDNGYRSYHIILHVDIGEKIPVEIQIRTISQDSWASLEHKMKYKKDIKESKMIKSELKRLADEMASNDICMQTLKELIHENM